MAEIPAALPAAAAQAVHRARETSREEEAHRAAEAHTADRNVKAIDEASAVVDTDDADNRVFADSEGLGSQGREKEDDSKNDEKSEDDADPSTGLHHRPDGTIHIDLQA